VRRLSRVLLALPLAVGMWLPLSAAAKPSETMACCMMHGRCDCGHSDASFARCTGQDVVTLAAVPPAAPPSASSRLETINSGGLVAPRRDHAASLCELVPPTPPPRFAPIDV
jgi:hypothetical protein